VQVRTSPSMPSLRSLSAPYASTTWGRSAPGVRSLLEATSQLFACLKKQNRSHAAAWCYGLPQSPVQLSDALHTTRSRAERLRSGFTSVNIITHRHERPCSLHMQA